MYGSCTRRHKKIRTGLPRSIRRRANSHSNPLQNGMYIRSAQRLDPETSDRAAGIAKKAARTLWKSAYPLTEPTVMDETTCSLKIAKTTSDGTAAMVIAANIAV